MAVRCANRACVGRVVLDACHTVCASVVPLQGRVSTPKRPTAPAHAHTAPQPPRVSYRAKVGHSATVHVAPSLPCSSLAHRSIRTLQGRWLKIRALASSLPRLLHRVTPPEEIKRLKRIRSEAFEAVKSQGIVVETDDEDSQQAEPIPFEKQGDLSLYTMVCSAA